MATQTIADPAGSVNSPIENHYELGTVESPAELVAAMIAGADWVRANLPTIAQVAVAKIHGINVHDLWIPHAYCLTCGDDDVETVGGECCNCVLVARS